MTSDAVLRIDEITGKYDISINENGDIDVEDFFDTAVLYSLKGERRAAPSEIDAPELRRGWIGNRQDFENGSKIWLFEQQRLTNDVMNRIADEARNSLQWLVDDGIAERIDNVVVELIKGVVSLRITIRRSRNRIDTKLFELWENTGVR